MYRFDNGQISIHEFGQPIGMKLHEDNRWVKKATTIPWPAIEKRYAALFTNQKGNVAKPLRLGLGACIIQGEYHYSDVETTLQIQENPYLQYFCGYKAYDDSKAPFDPSLMVYFRKRLTPEILGEINEMILATQNAGESDDDDDGNGGTIIVDATCAPSQIKYPQDTALLNEARENTETLIDALHTPGTKKPRTYRKRAHKDYLALVRTRKPGQKKIRKAIGQQLRYLSRNLKSIDAMRSAGGILTPRQQFRLETIRKVCEQQRSMYDARNHSVSDRIVSLSQPWLRPIVRGKAKAAVEFGAKLDISVVNGWTRLEVLSFDAYNEAGGLPDMLERYRQRTGRYPARVLADKIYRNRENLAYCKERNIRLSGPALGRPKKDIAPNQRQNYVDECERVEVERRFSLAKRSCGLGLITARLQQTACHCIAMSILLLNLRKIQCTVWTLYCWLLPLVWFKRKQAFVQ